jgi:hypothetical protein
VHRPDARPQTIHLVLTVCGMGGAGGGA